jgi:tetratricopeptide (TPR) repeat protein
MVSQLLDVGNQNVTTPFVQENPPFFLNRFPFILDSRIAESPAFLLIVFSTTSTMTFSSHFLAYPSSSITWKNLIEYYFSVFQYETARFYCERFYYEDSSSSEALSLLVRCYYALGKLKQAYMILSQSPFINSLENKYFFALICYQLGKYDEAEFILHNNNRTATASYDDLTKENMSGIPGGALGLLLMGKICRKQQRKDLAVKYLQLALQVRKTFDHLLVSSFPFLSFPFLSFPFLSFPFLSLAWSSILFVFVCFA